MSASHLAHTFLRMLVEDGHDGHDHQDEFDTHAVESSNHDDDGKPWGDVILASLLIQLVTLTGLIFTVAVGYFGKLQSGDKKKLVHTMSFKIIPSFAAGALLATSVFLVIPESLILLAGGHADAHGDGDEEGHDDHDGHDHLRRMQEDEHEEHNEAEASWKFGAALLGGFMFPILMHVFFPAHQHNHAEVVEGTPSEVIAPEESEAVINKTGLNSEEEEEEAGNEEAAKEAEQKTANTTFGGAETPVEIDWTLASSILLGDFFHNFTDGVFVGTAFLLCDRSVAWTIVATTVYHELAQEIADFALLHHHCGFSVWMAVFYNFVSGFSVMIGAVLILGVDMSEEAKGTTLAIAAGIYIYIAACECVPRINAAREGPKDTLLFLVFFILGAIPIGLVLLNHQHCEEGHASHGEEEDGHEDHDHLRFLLA